jgi:hypothetical protein
MKKVSGRQIQHGDVLLLVVETLPQGAKRIACDNRLVLAEGEATGHAHSIFPPTGAALFEFNEQRYLQVWDNVKLKHQEHHEITILPGIYEIGRVREVDPFQDEIRAVKD